MSRYLSCFLWAFLPLCLVLSARGEIRIATYNLRNYLVADRLVEGQWRPSYPKPEREKELVRRIISEAKPDILALQEIGTVDFLEELRIDLAQAGLSYDHALHLSGPDTERHIALLSNIPPHDVVKHTDLDFKYLDRRELVKRGMLEASFALPDGAMFKLFVVHLKSKYTEDKEDPESQLRRTREAEACRDRIIERSLDLGQEHFLVLGDFNDHPASAPLRRFYQRGSLEIGSLVPAKDDKGEVWTHFYKKFAQYSLVDGFIASPAMFPLIMGGEGRVVDDPQILEGSDHRMVYLDLGAGSVPDRL